MKKIYFLFCFSIIVNSISAQPVFKWANSIGGFGLDYGNAIDADASGNVFIAGELGAAADFDPSASSVTLTPAGGLDMYIGKYSSNGELIWAKNIGGTLYEGAYDLKVAPSGNIYVMGFYKGSVDMDPSDQVATLIGYGNYDCFFAKYDADGNFIWAKGIGSITIDYGYHIAVDNSDNIFIAGEFTGTADFDPGPASVNATASGVSDGFVAGYNSYGNFLWLNTISGPSQDYALDVAADENGNVIATGAFIGTADFERESAALELTAAGGGTDESDPFIIKYDANGNILFAKSIYGDPELNFGDDNYGKSIATDAAGNIYVSGHFYKTADFDPSTAVYPLNTPGGAGLFFAKYDADGNFSWAQWINGYVYNRNEDIAVDGNGDLYITGYFAMGSSDFDPSPSTVFEMNSLGEHDVFVAKYSTNGSFLWAFQCGGDDYDYGVHLALDQDFNLYLTGYFYSDVNDFDPGAGTYNVPHWLNGGEDIFFAKYEQPGVGVNDATVSSTIDLFPNPSVSGIFEVKLPVDFRNANVFVYDLNGRKILETEISNALLHLDLSAFPKGMYLLQCGDNEICQSAKLIYR